MTIIQHPKPLVEEDDLAEPYIQPGHTLPGYTVDRLIEQGKLDEARQELERLLLEGLDSGTPSRALLSSGPICERECVAKRPRGDPKSLREPSSISLLPLLYRNQRSR